MIILVINQSGHSIHKDSSFVPRAGDKIDMFFEPLPTVTSVICWPSKERLDALGCAGKYDAIVTVR